MTEDEKKAQAREVYEQLDKMYRDKAISEGRLVVPKPEKIYAMPSPTPETSMQKLRRANRGTCHSGSTVAPLTDQERNGLSEAQFNRLRPQLRMELYDIAMARRATSR